MELHNSETNMEVMRIDKPPSLLTLHGQADEKHSFYSLLENQYRTTCIPILCGKHILASTYGWLVLVKWFTDDCILFNPQSMETIELPRLHDSLSYNRCVMTKPTTEPDCYNLFNSGCTREQSFCRIGDQEFAYNYLRDKDDVLLAIASFQGTIYGLMESGYRFVTIDLSDKTLVMKPMMNGGQPFAALQPSRNWVTWHENYLVNSPCRRELLLVIKMYRCEWAYNNDVEFRVFRVDVNGMECKEVDDIGELTIFVGFTGSVFCCSSSGMIKPNSIYYLMHVGRDMYVYDLVDRSTCSLLPCPVAGRYAVNYWVDIQDDVLNQIIDDQ